MEKCPLCKGKIYKPKKQDDKIAQVKFLREQGLSYREIMKVAKISSTSLVKYYLEKEK